MKDIGSIIPIVLAVIAIAFSSFALGRQTAPESPPAPCNLASLPMGEDCP